MCVCVMWNSEQKTSNYVETNLASVDHATTSNLGVLGPDMNPLLFFGTDRPGKKNADWLLCMQRRESVVKKLLSAIVGCSMIAVVYFLVSFALHSTKVLMYCCHQHAVCLLIIF